MSDLVCEHGAFAQDCVECIRTDRNRYFKQLKKAAELLKRFEWAGEGNACPDCCGYDGQHNRACELAALLRELDELEPDRNPVERNEP